MFRVSLLLCLLVAAPAVADPFNPYAPTPDWTPPVDTWSQPALVQPVGPVSWCDVQNPYWTASCELVPYAPAVDDELGAAFAFRFASAPEPESVPEPSLLLLGVAGTVVWLGRRARR